MIDENKLIEEMWKNFNSYYNDANRFSEEETKMANRVLCGVQCMIESQTKVGEWIPCSERLPELTEGCEALKQSECCLVAGVWWDGEISEDIGWYNSTGNWNVDLHNYKVIAWMPLPEPYKGGEQRE